MVEEQSQLENIRNTNALALQKTAAAFPDTLMEAPDFVGLDLIDAKGKKHKATLSIECNDYDSFYRVGIIVKTENNHEAARLMLDAEKIGATVRLAPSLSSKGDFEGSELATAVANLASAQLLGKYQNQLISLFSNVNEITINITDSSPDGWTTRWQNKQK